MNNIYTIKELAQEVCNGSTIEALSKAIYNNTDCGAYIEPILDNLGSLEWHAIMLGSIVEGVDINVGPVTLDFGSFNIMQFWSALQQIEDEAKEIWNDTHGCNDCYHDVKIYNAYNNNPVNPLCETCNGLGVVI